MRKRTIKTHDCIVDDDGNDTHTRPNGIVRNMSRETGENVCIFRGWVSYRRKERAKNKHQQLE